MATGPGLLTVAIAAGLAFGPAKPIFATVPQENTPPHLLGRTFGALTAIAQAAIPLRALAAGVAVQRLGLIPTIVSMGMVYVVVTTSMLFNPTLRAIDIRREPMSEPTHVPEPGSSTAETTFTSSRAHIH